MLQLFYYTVIGIKLVLPGCAKRCVKLITLKLCCYALSFGNRVAYRVDTGIFYFFSRAADTYFARHCNYCDIATGDQGRQSLMTPMNE